MEGPLPRLNSAPGSTGVVSQKQVSWMCSLTGREPRFMRRLASGGRAAQIVKGEVVEQRLQVELRPREVAKPLEIQRNHLPSSKDQPTERCQRTRKKKREKKKEAPPLIY